MHPLLADVFEISGSFLVEEHHRLAIHHAILGAPKRKYIHTQVASYLPQGRIQTYSGVGDARAIHVQQHIVLVRKVGQRFHLIKFVNSSHFCCLRDGDHARLHVMLKTYPVEKRLYQVYTEFAVRAGHRKQFAASELFRRPALVNVDVGGLGADDSLVRLQYRLQAENVRAGTTPNKVDRDVLAKVLLELFDCAPGVVIVTVGNHVALIYLIDGFEYFRVDASVIVAGEASAWWQLSLHGLFFFSLFFVLRALLIHRWIVSLTKHKEQSTKYEMLTSNFAALNILENFASRVSPGDAGYSPAGMRARSAEIQATQWSAILGPAKQRTKSKELIQRLLTVMNVPTI